MIQQGKQYYYGTGRRKSSVARVRLVPGQGQMLINQKDVKNYFGGRAVTLELFIREPLTATSTTEKFDVIALVDGGGISGQSGAIRHGIARALVDFDEGLRATLRQGGYLTRDPREHERKKYGLYGRRRRFQYSKR